MTRSTLTREESAFWRTTAALSAWAARRPRLAAALALGLPVLLFYAPLLAGAHTFPDGDFTHHFLPFSLFQFESLRSLHLPLWNPHTYAGHPFLADTQAAAYYPVSNFLLLLTLPWRDAASRLYFLQVDAVLHTLLAGAFVYLLARGLGARRWASALGGVTFALSGYLVSYPPLQLAVLRSAIWLPLALWLLWRAARGQALVWSSAGAAVALACSFLGGHPQTVLHVAYVSAAWVLMLVVLVWRDRGWRQALLFAACVSLFTAAFAVFLSAAQLLPSLEFARLSVRANVDYEFVSGGFPLQDAWQSLLPGVFTFYSPLFVGVVPLGMIAVALAALHRSDRQPDWRGAAVVFFLSAALVALGFSFGGNAPLYPLAWKLLPGWNLFRGQERSAYVVAFCLSALAALGADRVVDLSPLRRRRAGLVFGAAVLAAVYAFGLLWQLPGRTAVTSLQFLWIASATMVLGVTVSLLLWLPGWGFRRSLLALGLSALPLYLVGAPLNSEPVGPSARVAMAPEVIALRDAVKSAGESAVGLPGRVYNEFRAYEDYSMRAGVEDLWGSSPLRLERYAALADAFPLDRWWSLAGVEHVLTWRRELFMPSALLAEYPQATDTTYLHRLAAPAPRAWLATNARAAGDEEARSLLADHKFDLRSTLLFTPESGVQEGTLPRVEGRVHVDAVAPERLRVEVTTSGDALLYLSQVWMPGWRVETQETRAASILGLPVLSVVRAQLAFMAVPVPAGSHSFDLVYAPESARDGLAATAAALLALALAGIGGPLRRRLRR